MVDKLKTRHPDFAARLQSKAKPAGIDIVAIRVALKVTYEMARRYWRGIAKPRGQKMEKLAALVGTTAAELEYGAPTTRSSGRAEDTAAVYAALPEGAREIAVAWSRLSPSKQQMYRDEIFRDAVAEKLLPWLKSGRPTKESYDHFEKRVERDYQQQLRQLKLEI